MSVAFSTNFRDSVSAQATYRQIIRATSIFGGVQVFNALMSIGRSKVIAIFLGPYGMGISSLYLSTINLVSVCTGFGLDTSAVKSISFAEAHHDEKLLGKEIAVTRRLAWLTGVLGLVAAICLSPILSRLTFGNSRFTIGFIWLSTVLLMKQLSTGQLAILQGLRRLRPLAEANLAGSFFGLILTVPLYICFGTDAIMPAIILSAAASLLFSWLYCRKAIQPVLPGSSLNILHEARPMLRLGLALSLITILTTVSAYLLQIFISHTGGIGEVGFFNAGNTVINSYAGLIFTAMSMEYFPRLAAISEDNRKLSDAVIAQAVTGALIITPIILAFLPFSGLIIRILFSRAFLAAKPMIEWGIATMLLKAASWSMGYVLIAKGDSRLFIKTSLLFNSIFLIINIGGYYLDGLEGLGITFVINYMIHFLVLRIVVSRKYGIDLSADFYRIFGICVLLFMLSFLFSQLASGNLQYIACSILLLAGTAFSAYELNRRMDIIRLLMEKIKRR